MSHEFVPQVDWLSTEFCYSPIIQSRSSADGYDLKPTVDSSVEDLSHKVGLFRDLYTLLTKVLPEGKLPCLLSSSSRDTIAIFGQARPASGRGSDYGHYPSAGLCSKGRGRAPSFTFFLWFRLCYGPRDAVERVEVRTTFFKCFLSLLMQELFIVAIRRRTRVHQRRIRHPALALVSIDWLYGLLHIPLVFTSHDSIPRRRCPCPNRQPNPFRRLWQLAFPYHPRH